MMPDVSYADCLSANLSYDLSNSGMSPAFHVVWLKLNGHPTPPHLPPSTPPPGPSTKNTQERVKIYTQVGDVVYQ